MLDFWRPTKKTSLVTYSNPPRKNKTLFKLCYDRGDIPAVISYDEKGTKILSWKVDADKLDYHQILPIFFDGLREEKYPYNFVVTKGLQFLLSNGRDKVLPVIPRLIMPIKKALSTHNRRICCNVMKVLQELVNSHEGVGEALVPYYRQLLPTFNLFINYNRNIGDAIEYSQRKDENIGDLIDETLRIMETKGGEYAYLNIKYMIPVYESNLLQ
ncbi:Parkin coregulated gene protein [Echinococcus granulosus]|uniref:Parkin coregulated gene protein n=1 Tax=Echinococcus granulosus TaxID=6210 RepID=U6JJ03_ECHGR|nr:Parkin coregulated gene protein [Echinococcus granulosus]EUB58365.1 Parkin coregulated gene protein [Echinococcus granulosus]CDS24069.1 parkin coregulated gene protein [Echinococcus granulosus]